MEDRLEIWKDIPGYEGKYQVSSLGRIKSIGRNCVSHQPGIQRFVPERILKPSCSSKLPNHYLNVSLSLNAKTSTHNIHRLVASAFLENPNNYPVVNHKDSNKQNNSVENLEWVTHKENSIHSTKDRPRNTKVFWNKYWSTYTASINFLGQKFSKSSQSSRVLEDWIDCVNKIITGDRTNIDKISEIENLNQTTYKTHLEDNMSKRCVKINCSEFRHGRNQYCRQCAQECTRRYNEKKRFLKMQNK